MLDRINVGMGVYTKEGKIEKKRMKAKSYNKKKFKLPGNRNFSLPMKKSLTGKISL